LDLFKCTNVPTGGSHQTSFSHLLHYRPQLPTASTIKAKPSKIQSPGRPLSFLSGVYASLAHLPLKTICVSTDSYLLVSMQNRLIITGIPPTVPRLPNAAEALRDLIEEHGCWVDRFAFLLPSTDKDEDDSTMITAAAELHIENVRDDAIHLLNGLKVVLDMSGSVRSTTKHGGTLSNTSCDLHHSTNGICFTIGAAPITPFQSKLLIEQCPIHRDDVENATAMEKQTLVLPLGDMQLTVRSSIENGGGTGSTPWRGGLLLSHQICHWYKDRGDKTRNNFDSLFRNKTVLELGAGCSGLPSMTLAKLARTFSFDVTLISSDGIDEIVDSLQSNVRTNGLDEYITVKRIDWNDYCNDVDGRDEKLKANLNQADTIIYSLRIASTMKSVPSLSVKLFYD
jgi:hypothetical protein